MGCDGKKSHQSTCQAFSFIDKSVAELLKTCHPPEGASTCTSGTPVTEFTILSRPKEVLAASVVGMLKEGPVSLKDIAGVDVTAVEALLDRLTVVSEFHHVTLKVETLIDAHPIRPTAGLWKGQREGGGSTVSSFLRFRIFQPQSILGTVGPLTIS